MNLQSGVKEGTTDENCVAGAGSLLLEFTVLSRLLGDGTYENLARRTNRKLWSLRDKVTGLLGRYHCFLILLAVILSVNFILQYS